MPNYTCPDCGKKLFHENETTLTVETQIHGKFCPAKKKH
jgi:transposase-like protein